MLLLVYRVGWSLLVEKKLILIFYFQKILTLVKSNLHYPYQREIKQKNFCLDELVCTIKIK